MEKVKTISLDDRLEIAAICQRLFTEYESKTFSAVEVDRLIALVPITNEPTISFSVSSSGDDPMGTNLSTCDGPGHIPESSSDEDYKKTWSSSEKELVRAGGYKLRRLETEIRITQYMDEKGENGEVVVKVNPRSLCAECVQYLEWVPYTLSLFKLSISFRYQRVALERKPG